MIKKNQFLLSLLTFFFIANGTSYGQAVNISTLPYTYADLNYNVSDFSILKTKSNNFRGQYKILNFTPSFANFSGVDMWPLGSWGNGYYSSFTYNEYNTMTSDYPAFYGDPGDDKYAGCHPLIRATSEFTRGHIQAYLATSDADHLDFAKEGVDYLLDEQDGASGGFRLWRDRANHTTCSEVADEDEPRNVIHPYETAYGLRALCEFTLTSEYKEAIIQSAVVDAADFLCASYVAANNNYNYTGLVMWGLAGAYKVTGDCKYRDFAIELSEHVINGQKKNGIAKGAWNNGQLVGDTDEILTNDYFHDTKIFYHMIILRGLIETMDITKHALPVYRLNLVNCLKRGVNHVIETRLRCNDGLADESTIPNLRYLWVNTLGDEFSPNYLWDVNGIGNPQIYEPIAALLAYSNFHDEFSNSDKLNLKNLLNYMGLNIEGNKSELYFFTSMGYYKNFLNAYSTNTHVFNWGGPDYHYNSDEITNNTISGDFDNDGELDDVAAFFYYGAGETRIHCWSGETNHFNYKGSEGWWNSFPTHGWYDATKISDRIVSGDFDGDGWHDDIAAFYDYGGSVTKIHVWLSNGSQFVYQGADGFWDDAGYDANKVTGRVVAGDFNDDDRDDIAAFYDYGGGETRIHVWKSNGLNFTYASSLGWWNQTGYDANKVTGRVVAGDFNNDDQDDIAAFYDYGGGETRIHVWKSSGLDFIYMSSLGWWDNLGYDANKVTGRVVSGDFDDDNYDDVAAFYDYGGGETRIHIWKSNGLNFIYASSLGWWNQTGYDANKITGRALAGDFVPGGGIDLCAFYDYGDEVTRMHVWKSTTVDFSYRGSIGWWYFCPEVIVPKNNETTNENEQSTAVLINKTGVSNKSLIKVYPNPTNDNIIVNIEGRELSKNCNIRLFSLDGRLVLEQEIIQSNTTLNLTELTSGTYLLQVINGASTDQLKVIKN